jgi:Na+-driven multidrug efflux pump
LKKEDFKLHFYIINSISTIAIPGMLQYVLASCSWIFLSHLIAKNGGEYGSAGFQTAVRIMMFFILPIWGLSNAAATLTGQFLGSNQKDKIVEVTKTTLKYSIIICAGISLFNYFFSAAISSFFCNDTITIATSQNAMEIISLGYIVYGISMIMNNIFNGLGDTRTPTLINILGFWIFQIPVTYYLISYCHYNYKTAIWIIPITEGVVCILYFIFFLKIKLLRKELMVLKHF